MNEFAEGRRLLRQGYGRALSDAMLIISRPVYWYSRSGRIRSVVLDSGTVFFLDLGERPFGVTAAHVIDGIKQAKETQENLVIQVGNEVLDPSEQLINQSTELDIATFSVSYDQLEGIGANVHTPHSWPTQLPAEGRGVFYGGFRGFERKEKGWKVLWGFSYGLGPATSVREDRVAIQFQREYWVETEGTRTPLPSEPWGGVSGGPVAAIYEGSVITWGVVGVVSEFSDNFEILFADTLSRLTPNGYLGR